MNRKVIIFAVIIAIVAGAYFWYWQKEKSSLLVSPQPVSQTQPASQPQVDQKTADISLGSQILQRTQNLLQDRFPETNPLKQIIKNPF